MNGNNLQKRADAQIQLPSIADLSEAFSIGFKALAVKADTGIAEALRLRTPNFGILNSGTGSMETSQSIISVLILNLLDFFTAEWNITQLEDCSQIVATDYYWLSQAEFKIFTLRCKKGRYGTDYGKLSPQRLLLWLEDFSQECMFERAGMDLRTKVPDKMPQLDPSTDFDAKPLIEEFKKRLTAHIEKNAEAETARQDENIRKYQQRLKERWRGLQEQHSKAQAHELTILKFDSS